ncbi:hypothetical protein E2562_039209 [Oryza meyeriana var. granulata]|uniref:Uncharacterized protein n=1 Tax=Oryza meyeriana var. granulata TaxID=110450 RepID=A0A6G1CWI7_9ORYZ|nr:hypothetical protein E2562_039209 [Oryza meyeriana var. granulata]
MFCKDPRFEVLGLARAGAGVTWSPLPRPPFRSRVVSLAVLHRSYRHGLVLSTEDDENYLFDGVLAAWVKLRGEPLPFEDRAVHTDDYLWLATSPADGRLLVHDLAVVDDGFTADEPPSVRCDTTVYLGGGRFCVVQAAGEAERVVVIVTVFKVLDSHMSWERRRERGMGARWVASELQAAWMRKVYSASREGKQLQICRLNLWSRTFVVGGGAGRRRGPYLAGALWT